MSKGDLSKRLDKLEVVWQSQQPQANELAAAWLSTLSNEDFDEYVRVFVGHLMSTAPAGASRAEVLGMSDDFLYGIIAPDFVAPPPHIAAAEIAPWNQRFEAWVAAGAPKVNHA